jgi:transposase
LSSRHYKVLFEELIPADHKARAIWDLVGRMDLSRFTESLRTTAGCAGRPAWDPRLMLSLWIYAYSEGISSAREIERLMEWEPGMRCLGGWQAVNHHSLSDSRIEHRAALDELFAQLLALLAQAGLVDLKQVMHDGTKIRAVTGADTFRREKTIRERLEEARQAVAQFGDPRAEAPAKDRQSAARERKQRMEAALEELMALPAEKKEEEKAAVRVSMTESEARIMQHGDGAMAASYNAQITTEASHKIIVGAHLSQCSSDVAVGLPDLQYSTVGAGGTALSFPLDSGGQYFTRSYGRGSDVLPQPRPSGSNFRQSLIGWRPRAPTRKQRLSARWGSGISQWRWAPGCPLGRSPLPDASP